MSEWKEVVREHFKISMTGSMWEQEIKSMAEEILRLRSSEAKLLGVVGKLRDALQFVVDDCACERPHHYDVSKRALASVSAEMKEIEG